MTPSDRRPARLRPAAPATAGGRRVAVLAALALLPALLSACGGDEPGTSGPGTPPATTSADPVPVPPVDATVTLRLTFEGLSGPVAAGTQVPDVSGNGNDGVVRTENADGPALTAGAVDGEEDAVSFTPPCTPASTCPKVVVEVPDAPAFVPGTGPLQWGARLRMDPDETSKGSNVVQKGFSVGGGAQWKLQVDGERGVPSCTVVGRGSDEINVAKATSTVADGRWHVVTCSRDGRELAITVDGAAEGTAQLPDGLDVAPQGPVRVGGKNLKPDNDQFFGELAEVWVGR